MVEVGVAILKNTWGQTNVELCVSTRKQGVTAGGTGLNLDQVLVNS